MECRLMNIVINILSIIDNYPILRTIIILITTEWLKNSQAQNIFTESKYNQERLSS